MCVSYSQQHPEVKVYSKLRMWHLTNYDGMMAVTVAPIERLNGQRLLPATKICQTSYEKLRTGKGSDIFFRRCLFRDFRV